jgi:hypothetical protein
MVGPGGATVNNEALHQSLTFNNGARAAALCQSCGLAHLRQRGSGFACGKLTYFGPEGSVRFWEQGRLNPLRQAL